VTKQISKSIRAKGTIIAISILMFSCFVSFTLMTFAFLLTYKNVLSIKEAHTVFGSIMLLAFILCFGIGSSLLYLALRRISRPIIEISNAAKEVAKGNFSVVTTHKSNDELGTLSKNFNLMVKELGNMEYLRKDFISSISHEFKTPIASIKGFAEMLQDKNLSDEEFRTYTGIIIEETGRLSQLSMNILRLSKLDNQTIPENKKEFMLDEQIRKTIVLLEEKWSKKNLNLDLDLDEMIYIGDEGLIQQIWMNLIENAIKFSEDSGEIFIQTKKTQNHVFVEIKDQGIGIDEKDQTRIYEKFFQGDKSHNKEGSGLGLAIVKKIVEICQGEIKFVSEKGKGTTFIVRLPI
jgi:signal transduction histidine kinase